MRRFILLFMPLALVSCSGVSGCASLSPKNYTEQTIGDERIMLSASTGYTAASTMGTALAKAGLIDKERFKALDAQGYALLGVVRTAYKGSNQADLFDAAGDLSAVVTQMQALVKGTTNGPQ